MYFFAFLFLLFPLFGFEYRTENNTQQLVAKGTQTIHVINKHKKETYSGMNLRNLIPLSNEENSIFVFTSKDNFKVELTAQQLKKGTLILAVSKNNKKMNPIFPRLVGDSLSTMYWIKNIDKIEKKEKNTHFETTILTYLTQDEVRKKYVDNKIPFSLFLNDIIPFRSGFFTIIAKDGKQQRYLYEKYLRHAFLEYDGNAFRIVSEAIPKGMQLKNIHKIIYNERMILFE